jgi:hypothetical protein
MSDLEEIAEGQIHTQTFPVATRRPRWVWAVAGGALVLGAGGAAYGLGVVGGSGSHAITGSLTLYDNDLNDACSPGLGYNDISAGTSVTVKNQSGAVIGTGALGAGTYASDGLSSCEFPFTVSGVPGARFYTVEVSHRGGMTYSAADLAAKSYKVDVSLGTP